MRYNETHAQGWGVSALHVVHCLAMIRGALQSARGLRGDDGGVMGMSTSKDPSTEVRLKIREVRDHHLNTKHVTHCFSYWRR